MREEERGFICFPAQGYKLKLEKEGLKIVVTDYHAVSLVIPWEKLQELIKNRPEGGSSADVETSSTKEPSASSSVEPQPQAEPVEQLVTVEPEQPPKESQSIPELEYQFLFYR